MPKFSAQTGRGIPAHSHVSSAISDTDTDLFEHTTALTAFISSSVKKVDE
jgi:hypothetical protein